MTVDRINVFDLETTGVNPHSDRIVTAYLGQLDASGQVIQELHAVVDPMVPIPDGAARVHGYTTERVAREKTTTPYQLVAWLHEVLTNEAANGIPLAGYNLQYDLTMLEAERARWTPNVAPLTYVDPISAQNGLVVIDALVLDKAIDPFRRGSRKLVDTAMHYGVPLAAEDAHNARGDAVASGRIALRQLASPKLSALSMHELHARQRVWKAEQAASLQNYFRTKGGKPNEVVPGEWPVIPTPIERSAS